MECGGDKVLAATGGVAQVMVLLRQGALDEHEQGLLRIRLLIRTHGSRVMNTLLTVDRINPLGERGNMVTSFLP